jgi:Mce-associated membrane protein
MAPDITASARSPRIRAALLAVLLVTTVASAALLVWALTSRGEAQEDQAQREEIMSVGEQFMLRKETFGPDDLDDQGQLSDYSSSVEELITPKLSSSFDEQTRALEQLVAKNGLESKSDVYASAVTGSDDDSADAIVVGDTTFSFTKSQSQTQSFRYHLTLVKTQGEWRVDSFEDVSGGQP